MTKNRTNRILLTTAAAVGLAAGAAGIAGAATGGDAGAPDPVVGRAEAEQTARAEVPGTVTSSEAEDDDGGDDGEETGPEQAALTEAATVSPDDAEQTALAAVPGTVHAIRIEDEDGTVVWDVEIDGDDGTRHDIQVDAATGEIVENEADDD